MALSKKLDNDEKIAIQSYVVDLIKPWLLYLGIANLVTLVVAFIYVFFVLPEKATEQALAIYAREIDEWVEQVEVGFSRNNEKLGYFKRQMEEIDESIQQIRKKKSVLETEIQAVEQHLDWFRKQTHYQDIRHDNTCQPDPASAASGSSN